MDATYQSRGITSHHKMGQGASQVISVACEDMQIISFHLSKKLCWVGSWLKNEGFYVQCPNGHAIVQQTRTL
jgi:uncharacterized protein YbcI